MAPKLVTPDLIAGSVMAVPPLARGLDLVPSKEENRRVLDHLLAGGVTTALYGGNANFYNIGVSEFGPTLDLLAEIAPDTMWIIPSFGPDYGKALDQAAILKGFDFPTAMLLPLANPTSSAGVATGMRRLADRMARPLIAYIRSTGYISVEDLGALVDDGVVGMVKYAVICDDPSVDPFLDRLVARVKPEMIVSGNGERPAVTHLTRFKLRSFTSGSVCVAPAMSQAILRSVQRGQLDAAEQLRQRFLDLEDLRDRYSPLTVLHAALETAGLAKTGPMIPFLEAIRDTDLLSSIGKAASALLASEMAFRQPQA